MVAKVSTKKSFTCNRGFKVIKKFLAGNRGVDHEVGAAGGGIGLQLLLGFNVTPTRPAGGRKKESFERVQ